MSGIDASLVLSKYPPKVTLRYPPYSLVSFSIIFLLYSHSNIFAAIHPQIYIEVYIVLSKTRDF